MPVAELDAAYQKVWQQKLLVTPGNVARFVGLPGNVGEEAAVSIYRDAGKKGGKPGGYWVTVTQASKRLWDYMPGTGVKPSIDPMTVPIERCDLPLQESTAFAIRDVWLTMLAQTRPEPKSESISLDSSTKIFSVSDSTGRTLRGQGPSRIIHGGNISMLIHLANSLIEYCNVPEPRRAEKARKIEKDASDLLPRVTGKRKENAG